LRIGIAVVVVGVFLVVPQTDHDHINSAVTPGVASHAFVPRSLWPQALIASVLCILVLQLLSVQRSRKETGCKDTWNQQARSVALWSVFCEGWLAAAN